jgi:UDP-N-acetylmuramate--alanine ligase
MGKQDDLLAKVKKIHFVGIGGSGMCPIAEILHHEGYQLTGSDVNESDTLARIRSYGIPVAMGHRAENIGDAEALVYSAAIMKDNPELTAAKERGIPLIERSVMLGMVSRRYPRTVAVSGTHGKTTTTSMITQIFLDAELDPTVVIGGKLPAMGSSGRVGKSDIMVCEACEYVDTFLQLHPAVAVVLNIDDDHLEYFKSVENTIRHFHQFCLQTSGMIVVNGDDENSMCAVQELGGREIVTFGCSAGNEYWAKDIGMEPGSHAHFTLMHKDEKLADMTLRIPGRHNIYNAVAAAAVAHKMGVFPQQISESIDRFTGAGRRFEVLGRPGEIVIADDYAHHPTELCATLTAAKEMGFRQVWAVFQPFTFSRTKMLLDDFAEVLQIADHVVMTEIMGSREINTYNIYTSDLAAKIPGSVWFKTFEEVADYVVKHAQPGDLVITLGCGDIYKAAKLMIKKYAAMGLK